LRPASRGLPRRRTQAPRRPAASRLPGDPRGHHRRRPPRVARRLPPVPRGGYADRPTVRTPHSGLVVAGDLVRTGLPVALMERAATSGFLAADALLERWGLRGHTLWTVPDRGR